MIEQVSKTGVRFAPPPSKFEAGTPNIEGAIGFAAALNWASTLDWAAIEHHEQQLLTQMTEGLDAIDGVRLYGRAENKVPVVSFTIENAHPHDIGTLLDSMGIAVRTGHHCTMPLMAKWSLPAGTVRASAAFYNTHDEIKQFIHSVTRIRDMLR